MVCDEQALASSGMQSGRGLYGFWSFQTDTQALLIAFLTLNFAKSLGLAPGRHEADVGLGRNAQERRNGCGDVRRLIRGNRECAR